VTCSWFSFTGSAAVGREIASACGQDLKRVSLELGGKNGQIVMEDADLELAWRARLGCIRHNRAALYGNQPADRASRGGQTGYRHVGGAREKIKIGDGLDEEVEMGPLINQAAREKVLKYIDIGKQEGRAYSWAVPSTLLVRAPNGYFFPTDNIRPSHAEHAHCAGRDFRAGC